MRRAYDDLVALGPLSVRIEPGELVALVGANGAGKTTLLAIAAGLSEWRDALTFGVMFLILVARPAGLFGARALRNA